MVTDSYCLVCLIMVPDVLERSTLGCVILGDVTTFIITLVSFLLESLDNPVSQRMLDPPPGEPWYEFESQASVVLVVVLYVLLLFLRGKLAGKIKRVSNALNSAWRILLIIWNCFDCCRHPFRPRDHTDHNLVHIRPSIDQM